MPPLCHSTARPPGPNGAMSQPRPTRSRPLARAARASVRSRGPAASAAARGSHGGSAAGRRRSRAGCGGRDARAVGLGDRHAGVRQAQGCRDAVADQLLVRAGRPDARGCGRAGRRRSWSSESAHPAGGAAVPPRAPRTGRRPRSGRRGRRGGARPEARSPSASAAARPCGWPGRPARSRAPGKEGTPTEAGSPARIGSSSETSPSSASTARASAVNTLVIEPISKLVSSGAPAGWVRA